MSVAEGLQLGGRSGGCCSKRGSQLRRGRLGGLGEAEVPNRRPGNETGEAEVESSSGTGRVKRKEGAKESEVGSVPIFIPCSGQPIP
jgi:hypothetical protein